MGVDASSNGPQSEGVVPMRHSPPISRANAERNFQMAEAKWQGVRLRCRGPCAKGLDCGNRLYNLINADTISEIYLGKCTS